MASEWKHIALGPRLAIALAALLIGTELRSGAADCRRNRIQRMTRSLAHKLEATTNLEFGEQGRDVKFYSAFRKIQFVGDFLVGKTAEDAIEDFFFTAGEAHGVFGAVAGFE